MTSYVDHLKQHRRLIILRVLANAQGYSANESILTNFVQSLGDKATRDQVRTEMAWLHEQGLIKNTVVVDLYVAEITKRGKEVATGIASVPGVQEPSPGD